MDAKRVSTIKSLTPRRIIEKPNVIEETSGTTEKSEQRSNTI